ncbi:MAG TPA: gamma-glutamyl-gamma-aminobutyrate hydrolase family protein [Candidatus Dormibacteraeota bacterium]|nr:gamma-glutamyl-gamma-aminobutyrate hydrolase family protein [Candidatus Dormibacteraeota bacterium]
MAGPVVAVTLRPQESAGLPPRLAQNRAYVDALAAEGAVPLCIPPLQDSAALLALLDRCDALLLPGGPDVEPARYGQEAVEGLRVTTAPALDAAELTLLSAALERRMPVLAVCRGAQLLNVALGGTLWQDVAAQRGAGIAHDSSDRAALVHDVAVEPGSALAGILGATRLRWNSVHHQGIDGLGDGLVAVAHAPDGLVEAVELPGRAVIGVQCHPEELAPATPWARALIAWLVHQAVAERATA